MNRYKTNKIDNNFIRAFANHHIKKNIKRIRLINLFRNLKKKEDSLVKDIKY